MLILNLSSLAATLDALNDVFFYGRFIPKPERQKVANWIASRQGKPRAYADMFAPTARDLKSGIRLFTGEKIPPYAGARHILGEEACRALILLDVRTKGVQEALNLATTGMASRLGKPQDRPSGMFCCGMCTPALWRHLTAGGLKDRERWLAAGMKALKAHRDGEGRWRRFPFYYTLLALSEIDLPAAIREMRYAAPICERVLRRSPRDEKHDPRRHDLIDRVLGKC